MPQSAAAPRGFSVFSQTPSPIPPGLRPRATLRRMSTSEPCEIVGVDIGGTFIDYCAVDRGGGLRIHKQLSDPADLAAAFLQGLRSAAPHGARRIVHGTTVATNALLERRGARTGLLATEGFADVLAIGRQTRPSLYALSGSRPPALVPPELRLEAAERLDVRGEVLVPLDEESVRAAARALAAAGVEAVAVSLLHAYVRADHERRAGDLLRAELGEDVSVHLSSDVLPEYREYERTSTTVATAYVAPLLDRYLARLARSVEAELQVMQSNGGVVDASEAAARSAHLVLSGPAGGVVGAFEAAGRTGCTEILTLDMGGTSTDVALCPGRIPTTVETTIAGVPLRVPMIDIHTIGAGGGSIARRDPGGALRVGPESAGADPGPACYGRGTEPTVTDADLVLGRLPTDRVLGGAIGLDVERARAAIAGLGEELGLDMETTALGILDVVHAAMQRAVRRVSVERGVDPRGFTLVAFGGAGPMHAAELAEELEVGRVLVPPHPGVASAVGMAAADEVRDFSRTVMALLDGSRDAATVRALWEPLEARAAAFGDAVRIRSADLRYVGQSFEIEVPAGDAGRLVAAFHEAHERLYGFSDPERPVEMVNVRLTATTPRQVEMAAGPVAGKARSGRTRLRLAGGWTEAAVVDRGDLAAGDVVEGPALVVQEDTTTVLPPRWRATADEHGNLVLEMRP
jgi:N-methylhydantoinase A